MGMQYDLTKDPALDGTWSQEKVCRSLSGGLRFKAERACNGIGKKVGMKVWHAPYP